MIPVDDHVHYPNTLLPGAPACVAQREFTNLRLPAAVKNLGFSKDVPSPIAEQIRDFFARLPDFAGRPCQSVVSIRLMHSRHTVGVLNIESSEADIIGEGSDAVQEIVQQLKPLCLMLACVVERDERNRDVGV